MAETVRIKRSTHAKLKQLSQDAGEPMPLILEKAIESYRRQRLLEQANRAYEDLRADPEAWEQEVAERKIWEATLADGQEDN